MREAILYPGYAFVDILQPCISFNKINTFAYYKNRVAPLGDDYDPADQLEAIKMSIEASEKIPTGILYREEKTEFHRKNRLLKDGVPLIEREPEESVLEDLIHSFI